MNNTIKKLAISATVIGIIAGMQIVSFASLDADDSSIAEPESSVSSVAESSTAPTISDIERINEDVADESAAENNVTANDNAGNPDTGAASIVLPSCVAIVAAATAAFALGGKKK